jgi:WW domain-containing oxidoreductase
MKDPVSQGCRSALFAATSPDVVKDQVQNSYIIPDRKVTESSGQAQNTVLGLNLWKLTKEVLESRIGELPYKMQTDELISRDSSTLQKVVGTAPDAK